ncbi:MAG: S-layer y protein [Clostridia bacterium]|jgi:hypothetical protein|nr:S-layer y protein [Clostridia bacterium]
MLKKSIVLVLIISTLVSAGSVPAFAVMDEPSNWAKAQVKEAIDLGIVPIVIQGKYQQTITREEFASLFVTTAFAWQKNNKPLKDEKYFGTHAVTREEFLSNIKVTDYFFKDTSNEDIKIAYMLGLVNGTSKTAFSPNNKITRQEAAVMLVNYYQNHIESNYRDNEQHILDLSNCAAWAMDSMSSAFGQGFLEGVSGDRNKPPYTVEMGPLGNFTREQAIIVAKRAYDMKVFATLKLRGIVDYVDHALKVDWEVSSNNITAIKLKEGMTMNERQDNVVGSWNWWGVSRKYPNATSEQMYAGGNGSEYIQFNYFSNEMVDAAGKGENATFDLGYAEYEMLNKDYIFQYRLKNNGVHNHFYYGGSKMLEIRHTRIK